MRRIMVVGCAGAGKSTFARRLSASLALPLVHLDFHYWRPGWQPPDDTETWREQVALLAASSDWIMDGNYSNTYDIRMPRADTLIWLDFSRATCMRRVLLRTLIGYGRTRPDLPANCPERFDFGFLRYVWDFPVKHRARISEGIEEFGARLRMIRLVDQRDVNDFLASAKAN